MALVVEDGTGLAAAEAYISEADADAYFAIRAIPAAWTAASSAEKEAALRMATEFMDSTWGVRWKGSASSFEQALDWPRSYVYDANNFLLASDELPTNLTRACAELAARQLVEELALDVDAGKDQITMESVAAGPVKQTLQFAGTKSTAKSFPKVNKLLIDLIHSMGQIERA